MESQALEHIRIMPEIVQELMNGLSEEQAKSKKSADDYSLAEMLEYMAHAEAHLFRERLDVLLTPGSAGDVDYDYANLFVSGTYSNRDPEESFAHWQERRDDNLDVLDDIKGGDEAALRSLLNQWAAHDLYSLGRIANCISAALYT